MSDLSKEQLYDLGWRDYADSLDSMMPVYPDMTEEQLQWYEQGWNAAKAQEEQEGVVSFLLGGLLRRMRPADEGYQLVKRIQAAYETEKQSPLQG